MPDLKRSGIRVLVADDHEIVRQGLTQILDETPGVEVVGEARDGAQALQLAIKLEPDVLLLDYAMPAMDAPSVIDHLRRRLPRVHILVLTIHESLHYALKALECGAHGFVVKSSAVRELVEGIRTVHGGDVYVSPTISQRVLTHLRRPRRDRDGVESLSRREFEMLRLLGAGMRLIECAEHLNISLSTASTYRTRLMEKLNVGTTAEIIRYALEQGIVS